MSDHDADPDVELASDCLTQTLHGPLPLATSIRLAEAVLRLQERPLEVWEARWRVEQAKRRKAEAEVERMRTFEGLAALRGLLLECSSHVYRQRFHGKHEQDRSEAEALWAKLVEVSENWGENKIAR